MDRVVYLPQARWDRWLANFEQAHGHADLRAEGPALRGAAEDGSAFEALWPWEGAAPGPAVAPGQWGVLLVRKGGFAVARMEGEQLRAHKVGQRHVQGRTKAGGQSQQRFARRRDNQARQAYEAAAEHAARILEDTRLLVAGGDKSAVAEVLADPRLRRLEVVGPHLDVPDPRRRELDQAIADAQAIRVHVHNVGPAAGR